MLQISEEKWEEIKSEVCDKLCYYATLHTSQESLDQMCRICPLDKVEHPLGRNDWQE